MPYESKRWIMLVSCMVMNICIGSGYAWSVFQKPLIELYKWTPAEASLAFTLVMGISALPMVIAGKAQQYVQPRTVILVGGLMFGLGNFFTGYISSLAGLYVVYGTIAGLGMGVVYSGGVSNMVRFFPDKRGLCSGMLAAGMGCGALIIAPIAAKLIAASGVMDAFKILGAAYTVIIVGLSFVIETAPKDFRPQGWIPTGQAAVAANSIEKNWKEMLSEPIFYVIAAMFVTGTISGLMIIGHASPILQQIVKVTPQQAAAMVGIIALANTFGRIGWGYLSDKIGRFPTIMILYIISGLCMFGLSKVSADNFFYLILLVGACFGGFMAMIASLTADSFGSKNLPINFGIMFIGFAIAAYYGPRIAAQVKMASGGYSQAFVVAAMFAGGGMVLNLIAMYLKKKRDTVHATKLAETVG
jgi:OFA family oxalate/formate antiporter-like MFS transporter